MLTSNRESGFGRYDIMLEPKSPLAGSGTDKAIIIEFKVQDKEEKILEDTVKAALDQIEDKQYAQSLIAKGFRKKKYGSMDSRFRGKRC